MYSWKKSIHPSRDLRLLSCGLIFSFALFPLQTIKAQEVKLGWDPTRNSSILNYNIYRATHLDSSFILLATVLHPDSVYVDLHTKPDAHYYYVATALDRFGSESGFSNRIDTTLQSIVPVELNSFSAQIRDNDNILLTWFTAAESNNYGFEVQRLSSADPEQFLVIGFVQGTGTENQELSYHFLDERLPEGIYYYRLKQIDLDGSSQFSGTIQVILQTVHTAHLYQNFPNPFNSSTEIAYELAGNSHVELTVYDELGRQVRRLIDHYQRKGRHVVQWDGKDSLQRNVGSGIYYYKITTTFFTAFRKMMLIK